eukprot:CAMPEP_0203730458 /NCGR_PEP_ID=MMETSP0092-20131115/19764_1 /ASSEMBLY_ACC=CAM_ASM_001090 /TAXON_ID=426623 /ORGANISM="Chaetoceros affinis, Strain CCMP159" /LENGTH=71 /DNA_ID=CAMNT_0050613249 /DNA_START=67 /DNA_END=279 /DNA_ORIENTATION=+
MVDSVREVVLVQPVGAVDDNTLCGTDFRHIAVQEMDCVFETDVAQGMDCGPARDDGQEMDCVYEIALMLLV